MFPLVALALVCPLLLAGFAKASAGHKQLAKVTTRMRAVGAVLFFLVTYAPASSTSKQLTVSPASVNFGTVTVGASASQAGTLSASGGTVKVSSASINSNEFNISGITFPITIAAGQSVPFSGAESVYSNQVQLVIPFP